MLCRNALNSLIDIKVDNFVKHFVGLNGTVVYLQQGVTGLDHQLKLRTYRQVLCHNMQMPFIKKLKYKVKNKHCKWIKL
jgi:hypothetical protein